ncbi:kelch-like protein 20 [Montipora capricornis]|uniref:kelch-like protein 20 n=1 Tax=Montipora capricornis TaxID=246305 RepID=UPI0035F1697C
MAAVLECADKETEIIGNHETDCFAVFHEMRCLGELCDITLKVNGKEVRAHRVVLAACSPYFRAMLTTAFVERDMGTISLQDCEENAVEKLVEFLYTCKLKLNESNVENVLRVAAVFQIHLVVQKCAEYLESQIGIENCLGIESLAMQYSLRNLESKVKSFITWNFVQVSRGSEFVLIPAAQLCSIVGSDRLHVKREEEVYEAVIRWYKFDKEERIKHEATFQLVRFPCMNKEYLQNVALTDELVLDIEKWRKLVEEAITELASPLKSKSKAMTRRKSPNVLYLIGELSSRIETFDLGNGCCRPVTSMAQNTGTAVVMKEELYVVLGGGTRVEKYDPKLNSWFQVGNGMKESNCAVCESMGSIYVIGGGKRAKSFNLGTRSWSQLPSMSMRRSFHSAVGLLGKVYAIGGLTIPGDQTEASVECYNPASNRWEQVAPMKKERCRHESTVMKNKIFVVGGLDGQNTPLKSVEMYDPATNAWSFIAPLNHPRRDFGLGVVQGMMFVFAGGGTNTIECYNSSGEWKIVGSLAKRWNTLRCVLCPFFQV